MPERKVRVAFPTPASPLREGTEVLVAESSEKWSEFTLEDGSVLRVKASLSSVIRIDGEFDNEGNPAYVLKMQPQVAVISVPDRLRQRPN